MVILDKLSTAQRRVLIVFSVIIVLIIVISAGYLMKSYKENKRNEVLVKQKHEKELSQKSTYDNILTEINQGLLLNAVLNLSEALDVDRKSLSKLGWSLNQLDCMGNVCNLKFQREADRRFNYVEIVKNENNYTPIFNEDELVFEGVIYDDIHSANEESQIIGISQCTEIISSVYGFNTTFKDRLLDNISVSEPTNVFSINNDYAWATKKGLKVVDLTMGFDNFLVVKLLKEYYEKTSVHFNFLSLNQNKFKLGLKIYCM